MPDPGTYTDQRAAARVQGRLLAWTTLVVALTASVGANVAQAQPAVGPRLTAAVAPAVVILASGLLERVPVARARGWQRMLLIGGLIFVVLAAFITSFQHQYYLLLSYGNARLSAVLLPLAVDVLIVMASVALAVIAEQRRELAEQLSAVVAYADAGELEAPQVADTDTQPDRPKRARQPLTLEERVARIYRTDPTVTASSVAIKLKAPERTIARHLSRLRGTAGEREPVTADA